MKIKDKIKDVFKKFGKKMLGIVMFVISGILFIWGLIINKRFTGISRRAANYHPRTEDIDRRTKDRDTELAESIKRSDNRQSRITELNERADDTNSRLNDIERRIKEQK